MLLLCYIKNVTLQISGGAAVSAAPTKQSMHPLELHPLIILIFNQIGTEKIKESRP